MQRKSYPSDLTDKEWELVQPLLRRGIYRKAGWKGKYSRRETLNAIFYLLRTGCQWTDLPHDFPPWKSVYSQYSRWRNRGVFLEINNILRRSLRKILGREEEPSAAIIDSQSVKTTEKKGSRDLMELRKLKVGKDTYWLITLDS